MSAALVIQARTGSTRLPRKVLTDVGGEPMLTRVVTRASRAVRVDEVWIATSTAPADDAIEALCRDRGWRCFRGNEADVLDRYWSLASTLQADAIVRVTADCPLIDPDLIDALVLLFENAGADYATTSPALPRGLDCEVIARPALERASREAVAPHERVHVTPYFYEHPELFRVVVLPHDGDDSHYRWTVDTAEDLALVRAVYEAFPNDRFTWRDVRELMIRRPDVAAANSGVVQKQLSDL